MPTRRPGVPVPSFVKTGNVYTSRDSVEALVIRGMSAQRHTDRRERMYASDAGFCERQAALNATSEGLSNQTAANTAYFEIGSRIEEVVLDALFNQGSLLFKQYRLPDVGLNLGGFIDGIITVAGRVRVLEVKSCGTLPTVPKGPHAAQALVYAAITGLPATLFYFSRSVAKFGGELLVKEFELDEAYDEKRAALFRAVYARMAMDAGVIPDKPVHLTGEAMCGFCSFTNVCWGGESLPAGSVPITPRQSFEMVKRANELVDHLMSPAEVESRRRGILSHISRAGNDNAKKLLAGTDWSELV